MRTFRSFLAAVASFVVALPVSAGTVEGAPATNTCFT